MNTRNFPLRVLKSLNVHNIQKSVVSRLSNSGQSFSKLPKFEEVQIQVPWGHICGKWYGSKNVRPIVCFHGWQDNLGTFDTLIPLLPKHIPFLAIDLPGHGLSSRIPDGMFYNSMISLYAFQLIMKEYSWKKMSILAHSMSSVTSFLFASIFPEETDMIIGIDALKPHIKSLKKQQDSLISLMTNFLIVDERNRSNSEPPSYKYDELIEKLHTGTFTSIDRDKCHYILERNIKKSDKYEDQYYFTRDNRLKFYNYTGFTQELCLEMARKIKSPYLFIKASNSTYFEQKEYVLETLEVLKQSNPKFEFYGVDGKHHVHLNQPEKISAIINPFICKYHFPEKY